MAGPKKLPTPLHVLRGTFKRSRHDVDPSPGMPAINGVPAAPDWLAPDAAAEFRRLATAMQAVGLMTEGRVLLLAHACALNARLIEAWSTGTLPTASLISTHRRMLGDLGLTALKVVSPARKENVFLKIAERSRR